MAASIVFDPLSCIRPPALVRMFDKPQSGALRHMVRDAFPIPCGWNGSPPESPDPMSWSRKSEYGLKVTLLNDDTTPVLLPLVVRSVTFCCVVKLWMWQMLQPMVLNTVWPAVVFEVGGFGGSGAINASNWVILIMLT